MRQCSRGKHSWATILRDVRWGILVGWVFAAGFSLYVLGLSLLRGSTRFDRYGMTAWGVILAYVAAGTLAGALVGLLRPLTRHRLGGALVGALAGTIVYGAVAVAMDGWADFDPTVALILGIPVGGVCGYRFAGRTW